VRTPISLRLSFFVTIYALMPLSIAEPLPSVPHFKSVCVQEKATGFSWTAGAWKQANFVPDRKLLIQKIDFAANAVRPITERQMLCRAPESTDLALSIVTQACYIVKEFGSPTLPTDGEMCYESFQGRVLKSVTCRRITFLPNGPYIELPWHMEIDPKPKDNYKDSLMLSVGTCTTLAD
jgi:hypothetical protein